MDLNSIRQKLYQERESIYEQLESVNDGGLTDSFRDSISELSLADNHPGDLGSEMFERGKDLALRDNLLQVAKQINHALEKVDRGEYGKCERCGRAIPLERLHAVPYATECIQCREVAEDNSARRDTRPIEEELLSPPFARTWTDSKDSAAYDGEDALQEATRYGTSETNEDYPGSHGPDDAFDDANELQGVIFPEEAYVATDIYGREFQMDPDPKKRRKS